jgi:hypothetical protein
VEPFETWRAPLRAPDGLSICYSPEWTPAADLDALLELAAALGSPRPAREAWRARIESRFERLERGEPPLSLRFRFPDAMRPAP